MSYKRNNNNIILNINNLQALRSTFLMVFYYCSDEQRGSTIPSRKREREEPRLESPRKRRKREPMCTPVRQVLQTSVVENSPAVAVSVGY